MRIFWPKEHVSYLRRLVYWGVPDAEIAESLHRTTESVRGMRKKLGIQRRAENRPPLHIRPDYHRNRMVTT